MGARIEDGGGELLLAILSKKSRQPMTLSVLWSPRCMRNTASAE
jgi:hypothetical protein